MDEKFVKAKLQELDYQNIITLSVEIREVIKNHQSQIKDLSNQLFRIDIFTKKSTDLLKILNTCNALRWHSLDIVEMIEKLSEIKNVMNEKKYIKN